MARFSLRTTILVLAAVLALMGLSSAVGVAASTDSVAVVSVPVDHDNDDEPDEPDNDPCDPDDNDCEADRDKADKDDKDDKEPCDPDDDRCHDSAGGRRGKGDSGKDEEEDDDDDGSDCDAKKSVVDRLACSFAGGGE